MSSLHHPDIGPVRKYLGYFLSIVPSVLVVFSGTLKLMQNPMMVENLEKVNLGEVTPLIGLLEIACVILYWVPKTSNLGFFLICSYVGGIIVAEYTMGGSSFLGIITAVLFYSGTLLRKKELSGFDL